MLIHTVLKPSARYYSTAETELCTYADAPCIHICLPGSLTANPLFTRVRVELEHSIATPASRPLLRCAARSVQGPAPFIDNTCKPRYADSCAAGPRQPVVAAAFPARRRRRR